MPSNNKFDPFYMTPSAMAKYQAEKALNYFKRDDLKTLQRKKADEFDPFYIKPKTNDLDSFLNKFKHIDQAIKHTDKLSQKHIYDHRKSELQRMIIDNNKNNELMNYSVKFLNPNNLNILYGKHGIDIPKPKSNGWLQIVEQMILLLNDHNFGVISFNEVTKNSKGIIKQNQMKHYTISKSNYKHVLDVLNPFYIETKGQGSDYELRKIMLKSKTTAINFRLFSRHNKDMKTHKSLFLMKRSGFFKYYHSLDINLRKFQMFKKDDVLNESEREDPCVTYALIQSGILTEGEINKLREIVKEDYVPVKDFERIAKTLNISIRLRDENLTKDPTYGTNKKRLIKLYRFDEHVVLNAPTDITKYALEHYDDVKHLEDFNRIDEIDKKGYLHKRNCGQLSIMKVVRYLYKNKDKYLSKILFEDFKNIKNVKSNEETFDNLDYSVTDTTEIIYQENKNINTDKNHLVFFDFETTTDSEFHKAYMISATKFTGGTIRKSDQKVFNGELSGLDFLKWINKDSIIFAHNFKYDLQFIFKYMYGDHLTEKDGKIMGGTSKFYNKETKKTYTLTFRDTQLMIAGKLAGFSEMFLSPEEQKLIHKEVIPYSIFNSKSVNETSYNFKDAVNRLKTVRERAIFKKNIREWGLMNDDSTFNHIEYSRIYCDMDVKLMYTGYFKFREWMLEITGLDIINFLTISSIAYSFMIKEGCLEECYKIGSVARKFIQKCVVGGRCMMSHNLKDRHVKKIFDFDAVSLYPSAMARMGFLKGKPFVIKQLDYEYLQSLDGYFVEIDIKAINKKRIFPLISRVNANIKDDNDFDIHEDITLGVREFRNDLIGRHYVDKVTLEDWIKYQEIEFEVIKGYGFNSGKNYKIQDFINKMFNERRKKKAEKNKCEQIYKLIMNSCYGKTILKETKYNYVYKTGENDIIKYRARHCDYIRECTYIEGTDNNKCRFKEIKKVDDHQTSPHVGVEILSMSKRIMNEVMCLAEDLGIDIFYQDTDSMHIISHGVKKLEKAFRNKYNRELIGKDMGQFHNDFDFKHDDDTEPFAVDMIKLGKKSYVDKVSCIRDGEQVYEYQVRLKGVPRYAIDGLIKRKFDNDYMMLYEYLLDGKPVIFDLLEGGHVKFKYNPTGNFTISSLDKFTRKVSF